MPKKLSAIRREAAKLNLEGDIKYKAQYLSKAKDLYKAAIKKLEEINEEERTSHDWRSLATFNYNMGLTCEGEPKEFVCYESAIASIEHIPEKERTFADWRVLASYHHNKGLYLYQPNQNASIRQLEFESHAQAFASLSQIPEKDRDFNDWRNLAGYKNNMGLAAQDESQELACYEHAIDCIQHISQENRIFEDWDDQSLYQINMAKVWFNKSEWKKAQSCFCSVLDSLYQAVRKPFEKDDQSIDFYDKIITSYDKLFQLSFSGTLENQSNSFALHLFDGSNLKDCKKQFLQLHLAMLQASHSDPSILRRGYLQMLQIIQRGINKPGFPNEGIKVWLSDEKEQKLFNKMLQEAEEASNPLSLLKATDQAPTLSVALVTKLLDLEGLIDKLNKENENLKEKVTKLESIYKHNLTVFGPTSHNKQTPTPETSVARLRKP